MKNCLCFLLLLLVMQCAHSQNPETDSLKKLLLNTKSDTAQIRLLNQLAEKSEDTVQLQYATLALQKLQSLPSSFHNDHQKFFYYQLASSNYWLSNYYNSYTQESDTGMHYLLHCLAAAQQINDPRFTGLVYGDFAVLKNYKGVDTSLYWLDKSLPYTIAANDSSQIGTAHNNYGFLYRVKGEYQKALDHLFIGMGIDQRMGNEEDVAIELNNIGQIYKEMAFYEDALKYFRMSAPIRKGLDNGRSMAITYNNIAGVFDDMHLYDSALIYYDSSLTLRLKIGSKAALAESYSNIGYTWMNLKDYDKAISYFYQSRYDASQSEDTFQYYSTLTNLADAFLRKGINTDSAILILNDCYDYFKVNGSLRDIRDITHLLVIAYGKKKDFKRAYEYTQEYLVARDSVESRDARKNALRKQFEFEYQNKAALAAATQKEKDDLAAEKLREQKVIRNYWIGGVAFLLIILGLLFNRFRLKQRAAKELEAKNKIIEQEKQRAEESEKFKSRFLANMSHEIRTPMNAVIGLTDLLLDSSATEKQKFYLDAIKKSSQNLMVILNDVLDLSKLEAGKMQLEKIPFRIQEIAENVVITLRHKAEEKGLKLETIIDQHVPEFVKGDPSRLYQVLINLVGNAVKFTGRGNVTLSVSARTRATKQSPESGGLLRPAKNGTRNDGLLLTFSVEDTGIGIAKEKLQTIFESFRQAEQDTSRKFGGTGLGLSISQQIVHLHGSEIEVKSEENKGSVFSFTIQYEVSSKEEFEKYHGHVTAIDYSRFSSLKILLAEDNEYNQLVTVESLKRLVPTIRIDVVENGKEALEALTEEDYDLILMDVQMPEMSGYEATSEIRNPQSEIRNHNSPIIALTASATRDEIDNGFKAGISAHLAKPFVASELLQAIAKVLGWNTDEGDVANNLATNSSIEEEFDISSLKKYSEGDIELMKIYTSNFMDAAPKTLVQVKEAFNQNNPDEIRRVIHAFKPQLKLLGLNKLNNIAGEIETCVASEASRDKIAEEISRFDASIARAIAFLSQSSKG